MPAPDQPIPARQLRSVLLDLGGVFVDWDPRHLYRKIFVADEQAMEDFLAHVCSPAWHEAQDRGKDTAQACSELAAAHPEHAVPIAAWAERYDEMDGSLIEASVQALAELKTLGVPCYALSNMERHGWERRLGRYEFLSWFDGAVISAFEGVAKPDKEIFQLALHRFGLDAHETLFVDDREVNVDAAAALGFQTALFPPEGDLRAVLAAHGLLAAHLRLGG